MAPGDTLHQGKCLKRTITDGCMSVLTTACARPFSAQVLEKDPKFSASLAHVLTARLVEQLLYRYKAQEEEQQKQQQKRAQRGLATRLSSTTTGDKFRSSFEGVRIRALQSQPTARGIGSDEPSRERGSDEPSRERGSDEPSRERGSDEPQATGASAASA